MSKENNKLGEILKAIKEKRRVKKTTSSIIVIIILLSQKSP